MWDALFGEFFGLVADLLGVVFGLMPAVPSWLGGGPLGPSAGLATVSSALAGLNAWLPLDHAVNVATAVVSTYLTAGFVGAGRSAVSSFTGGGGAS